MNLKSAKSDGALVVFMISAHNWMPVMESVPQTCAKLLQPPLPALQAASASPPGLYALIVSQKITGSGSLPGTAWYSAIRMYIA